MAASDSMTMPSSMIYYVVENVTCLNKDCSIQKLHQFELLSSITTSITQNMEIIELCWAWLNRKYYFQMNYCTKTDINTKIPIVTSAKMKKIAQISIWHRWTYRYVRNWERVIVYWVNLEKNEWNKIHWKFSNAIKHWHSVIQWILIREDNSFDGNEFVLFV